MNILRVEFVAHNRVRNQFAQCFILIQEIIFSISAIYKIAVSKNYFICSEIRVDRLIKEKCEESGGEFWDSYLIAMSDGFSFTDFSDRGNLSMNFFRVPRIIENDFEKVITSLGGEKIPETHERTPDFVIENVLLELKDLQKESLENEERQKSIARLFENRSDYSINIDPSLDFGSETYSYHRQIKNTIKNHFKSASKQIKQHRTKMIVDGAGIVIFNTGLYSLPHELFKKMVSEILKSETNTIEFALIFSQRMQTNGWDMYAVFACEWIGDFPSKIERLKTEMHKLVDFKMTEMMQKNESSNIIESQRPISFERDNKVFFWNPGQIRFPWEQNQV